MTGFHRTESGTAPNQRASARLMLIHACVTLFLVMAALLLVAIGTLPAWPYSAKLGYYPSGISGAILFGIAWMVVVGRL